MIFNLQSPRTVKEIRSFLGYVGFYHRFIKNLSKISRLLCSLRIKDVACAFDNECLKAFEQLKAMLTSILIIQPPIWEEPFEIMYNASDCAVGAALGQRVNRLPHMVYYANRTLNDV